MDLNDYNWRMDDMRDFVFVMFEGVMCCGICRHIYYNENM